MIFLLSVCALPPLLLRSSLACCLFCQHYWFYFPVWGHQVSVCNRLYSSWRYSVHRARTAASSVSRELFLSSVTVALYYCFLVSFFSVSKAFLLLPYFCLSQFYHIALRSIQLLVYHLRLVSLVLNHQVETAGAARCATKRTQLVPAVRMSSLEDKSLDTLHIAIL